MTHLSDSLSVIVMPRGLEGSLISHRTVVRSTTFPLYTHLTLPSYGTYTDRGS